ncbi:NAD-dependent epimerase/dehydratase family protein [Saccharothrix coeruleofusca]|uniref:Nucleoside-diphosphate sugar epimerase n=1 Tax=Saccharothrix coeruleofusca TaxID=33919 RepID=A0A918AU87_9PSEU|nr:NAD-dependent epimerase/dehydratase family protein [Saccharothrix coeruleofusca]GGP71695.1 nucleoside-diphosphate sugar epimerase [Saccharothrix coeruleofusca]
MEVVVTGASGNVGTALRRVLGARSGTRVVGIARRVPASGHWVRCDLGDPTAEDLLTRTFTGVDAVVHLAWAIQPGTDEPAMRRTNIDGSARVLRAAERAGVPHVVVASSVAAYSPGRRWERVGEDWPCGGVTGSAYSEQKAELERMLQDHSNVARVRPCAVVQPDAAGEVERWTMSPLLPASLAGRWWLPVPLWSGLRLQLVHAQDVARAIALILRERAVGAFNVASEPVLDADELARAFGGFRVPVPLPLAHAVAWPTWRVGLQPLHPGWLRLADRAALVDTGRLRALGWAPRHDARAALEEFVEALAAGRGTWGPLAPGGARRWRRLGWGRPARQDQGGDR